MESPYNENRLTDQETETLIDMQSTLTEAWHDANLNPDKALSSGDRQARNARIAASYTEVTNLLAKHRTSRSGPQ